MKTILIATDFSNASYDAVKYGIQLGAVLDVRVVLLHVFQVVTIIPDAYTSVDINDLKQTAEKELYKEAKELMIKPSQEIDVLAVEGDAVEMILLYSNKYADCLLICGIKSAGKSFRRFFGDTITSLLKSMEVSLLIVPEGYKMAPIKKISLATSVDTDTDLKTLDQLKDIATAFESKILVVRVMETKFSVIEEIKYHSERLTSYLKDFKPEFYFPKSNNVTASLNDFTNDKNVGLLVMLSHPHNILERLLSLSETDTMVFRTQIPLLILPEIKMKYPSEATEQSEIAI